MTRLTFRIVDVGKEVPLSFFGRIRMRHEYGLRGRTRATYIVNVDFARGMVDVGNAVEPTDIEFRIVVARHEAMTISQTSKALIY